ncbi:unnamed protein product [Rhizophagus irregularis]|nr:unnamed protein product [Rhizophagus irregularis]
MLTVVVGATTLVNNARPSLIALFPIIMTNYWSLQMTRVASEAVPEPYFRDDQFVQASRGVRRTRQRRDIKAQRNNNSSQNTADSEELGDGNDD